MGIQNSQNQSKDTAPSGVTTLDGSQVCLVNHTRVNNSDSRGWTGTVHSYGKTFEVKVNNLDALFDRYK